MEHLIPNNQLCDSGCNLPAKFFSKWTGRYRCSSSSNSCPANKLKNSDGIKQAHKNGRIPGFSADARANSHTAHRRKLIENSPFEDLGHQLRKKIVLEEQEYKCSYCQNSEWMGLRITLELDHIDGNRNNNVRSNLRGLCPNCHSITDTWKIGSAVGKKVRKCSDDEIIAAFKVSDSLNLTLKKLGLNWGSAHTVKKVLFRHGLIEKI
jgi:Zn finger protein HypA/HybF involved in hydrogenase expression